MQTNQEQPKILVTPTTLSNLLYGNASSLPLLGEKLLRTADIQILENIETIEKSITTSQLNVNDKKIALISIGAATYHTARCEFLDAYQRVSNLYSKHPELYVNNPNLTAVFNLTLSELSNKANLSQTLSHALTTELYLDQAESSLFGYKKKSLENSIITISAIDKELSKAKDTDINSHVKEVIKKINQLSQLEIIENLSNIKNFSSIILESTKLNNRSKETIINSLFKIVRDENLDQYVKSDPSNLLKLNLIRGMLLTYLAQSYESRVKPYDSNIADLANLLLENPTKFPLFTYSDMLLTAKLAYENDLFDDAYKIFSSLTRSTDLSLLQNKEIIVEGFVGSMKSSYKSRKISDKISEHKIKEHALQYLSGCPNETLRIEIASAEILLDKEKKGLLSDENLQLLALTLEGLSRRSDIDQKIKDRALKLANTLNEIISN